jgi:SAM-dependent methyltransferase
MSALGSPSDWELRWAPYDQPTYDLVLAQLKPSDVVLDIGAGDLRLARQAAARVQRVYAIERNTRLLGGVRLNLPSNLTLIEGDALTLTFPTGITCGILLMRHCTHYALYAGKVRKSGAARLITNARWRMSVESVDLLNPGCPHVQLPFGWYACQCGATGFKPGPADALTPENIKTIHEVCSCPDCSRLGRAARWPRNNPT